MQIIIAKEHEKLGGIYSIINKTNGKIYWGQTKNFLKRALQHCSDLVKNRHCNSHLQRAYNLDNTAFVFTVYLVESDKTKKDYIEEELIELFGDRCYNIEIKACPEKSTFSHTPEETRAKLSAALKGRVVSEETRAKMRAALKGRVMSEESRAKMSAAQKGKVRAPRSEEYRAKLRAAGKAQVHGPLSEETKAKLRAAAKVQVRAPISEETRAKLRAAAIAQWKKKKVEEKND